MFSLSKSKFPTVWPINYRHLGAIAALILISLLSSFSGVSPVHTISNSWDGFLWGLADPVLRLDSFVSILAMGLLSGNMVHSSLMTVSFIFAAMVGIILHLLQINLFGAEIAIAVATIALGGILVMPNQRNWVIVVVLGAIAGTFLGYVETQSLLGVGLLPTLTYILGTVLTLYAVATSAKQIVNSINKEKIQNALFWTTRFVGFAVCGIGMVFLSSLIA
ncbi:HupE/UreJ family protein [Anabaena minutissima FACHB-250]|nr:HupE/UreJ family protein [Anabaena minutissima FACHB-250]